MNSKPVNYKEAVEYIESIPKFTQKHTQEHTREFLERLGRPAFDRKVVHVAGTNGKGSVCAYIQAILEAEGKKTGFFTSPHLISINERIQIGREPIDNEKFYQVFEHVYDVVKKMEEEGIPHPSYFELLFGMGLSAFEKSDVECISVSGADSHHFDQPGSHHDPREYNRADCGRKSRDHQRRNAGDF